MDQLYVHSSGGTLYQSGAGQIPGTPDPWNYRWFKPKYFPENERRAVHDNITSSLLNQNITLLVLAGEYQPPIQHSEIQVLHIPFDDDFQMSDQQLDAILKAVKPAAIAVADQLEQGKNALVTCWAGKNRSSLVSGLALKYLKDPEDQPLFRGPEVIELIRKNRHPRCLCNPIFHDLVYYNTWES